MIDFIQSLFPTIFLFTDSNVSEENIFYIWPLVFVAFIVTVLGAYTGLSVIREIFDSKTKKAKNYMHFYASFVLGAGMWVMHFVSMLSHDMGFDYSYYFLPAVLIIISTAAICYGFLSIIRYKEPSFITYSLATLLFAIAISMNHYASLFSMNFEAKILIEPLSFILSLVLAVIASAVSISFIYKLKSTQENKSLWHILTSFVIGVGIFLMHYICMEASHFFLVDDCCLIDIKNSAHHTVAIIGSIFISALIFRILYWKRGYLGAEETLWNYTPKIIFLAGVVITAFCVSSLHQFYQRQDQMKFITYIKDAESVLFKNYSRYEQALKGAKGFVHASNSVSLDEWKMFVQSIESGNSLAGVKSVGMIQSVFEEATYQEQFVVKYAEPDQESLSRVGVDIRLEETLRIAAEIAKDKNTAHITRKINWSDHYNQVGFFLFMPFFRSDFDGWVFAKIIAKDFLEGLDASSKNQMAYAIYDGVEALDDNLIFKKQGFTDAYTRNQITSSEIINLAGRNWSIVWQTTPNFVSTHNNLVIYGGVLIGLIITTFMAAFAYTQNTRTKVIQNYVKNLQKADAAKDLFLANISHELRTPLNSILGLIKLLLVSKKVPEDYKDTLRVIEKSAQSLLDIVDDILDLSKIEADKISLEYQPFNINAFLETNIEMIDPLAAQKGLNFKYNVKDLKNTSVLGDEFRLSRIILNLASNAIKYTKKSGDITLSVDINTISDETVEFVLSISDTGIGIAEDKIDHIFDKFTQAEESTERKYGGTGLGLNITKQLVSLMGGHIIVESELGKGSIFTVTIPFNTIDMEEFQEHFAEAVPDAENTYNSQGKMPLSKAKVLVAEDHELNQIFIKKLLKQYGCTDYKIVENGALAVSEFQEHQYNMILMDCHMPNMNGYNATKEIRVLEKGSKKRIPIVALTADAMIGTREKCLKAGMDEYVSKPIDIELLKKIFEKWFTVHASNYIDPEATEEDLQKAAKKEEPSKMIDLGVLAQYTDDDEEKNKELIQVFYRKSMEDMESLSENIVEGESKEWSDRAHSLKGSAAYIGADILYKLLEQAQSMKTSTKKAREEIYAKIKAAHDEICQYLRDEKWI